MHRKIRRKNEQAQALRTSTSRSLTAEDFAQLRNRDITPAQNQSHMLTREFTTSCHCCGNRGSTSSFSYLSRRLNQEVNTGNNLLVAYQHYLVHQVRKESQWHGKWLSSC
jgi:hypothetical protein